MFLKLLFALVAAMFFAASSAPADATPRLYKVFKAKPAQAQVPKRDVMKQQSLDRCKTSKNEKKCTAKTDRSIALLEERSKCRHEAREAFKGKNFTKERMRQKLALRCDGNKHKALAFLLRPADQKKKRS